MSEFKNNFKYLSIDNVCIYEGNKNPVGQLQFNSKKNSWIFVANKEVALSMDIMCEIISLTTHINAIGIRT